MRGFPDARETVAVLLQHPQLRPGSLELCCSHCRWSAWSSAVRTLCPHRKVRVGWSYSITRSSITGLLFFRVMAAAEMELRFKTDVRRKSC